MKKTCRFLFRKGKICRFFIYAMMIEKSERIGCPILSLPCIKRLRVPRGLGKRSPREPAVVIVRKHWRLAMVALIVVIPVLVMVAVNRYVAIFALRAVLLA